MKFSQIVSKMQDGDRIRRKSTTNGWHIQLIDGELKIGSGSRLEVRNGQLNVEYITANDWVFMEKSETVPENVPFIVQSCQNRAILVDGVYYERKDKPNLENEEIWLLEKSK